jgi:hypothetical protein
MFILYQLNFKSQSLHYITAEHPLKAYNIFHSGESVIVSHHYGMQDWLIVTLKP